MRKAAGLQRQFKKAKDKDMDDVVEDMEVDGDALSTAHFDFARSVITTLEIEIVASATPSLNNPSI